MKIQRDLLGWLDANDRYMKHKLIQLLCLLLSIPYICDGQDTSASCIRREQISSQSDIVQSTTDDLLSSMPKPKRVTYNRTENFFDIDSSDSVVVYSQEINLMWFKNIGYRDVQGLASLYWISFKHNSSSIIIEDQVISKSFTLDDFQNVFDYSEQNVYYQDRKNNLVCQDSPKQYYTYICLPLCNSTWSESIVFCFNKKGFIDNIRLYTTSPLIPCRIMP